jgi:hypothetical protein
MINLPGENDMSRLEVREGDDYWMIYFGGGGYYQRKEPTRVTGDPLSPHEIMIIELCKALNTRQQGWVSVEDRLPENGQKVRIYAYNIGYDLIEIDEIAIYYNDKREPSFFQNNSEWDMPANYVTHWMPLPSPPTEVPTGE